MKRKALLTAIVLAISLSSLLAKHSDEYLLGNYSYIKNSFPFFLQNREALCQAMKDLGYNASIIETDAKDTDFSGLLEKMDKYGIDTWVTDRGWVNDPKSPYRYAITPLSTSNYLRLEAEFSDEQPIKKNDNLDSKYWYAFRNDARMSRTGKAIDNPTASYGNTWKLTKGVDKAGHALWDLRYRWPNKNGDYIRFGKEFQLYQKNPPSHEDNFLWIRYRVKVSNLDAGITSDTELFRLQIVGYELSGGGYSREEKIIPITFGKDTNPETSYRLSDLQVQKSNGEFFDIAIKVAYSDLVKANLLTADLDDNPSTWPSAYLMKLSSLNPRLYWTGNCDLELDFVEIEDQIHHELASDTKVWSKGILERANSIVGMGKGNVSGFYTFDEPYQGQFSSYQILQDILKQDKHKLLTATYDYQYHRILQDKAQGKYYQHLDVVRDIMQPDILANDIYPVKPETRYNLHGDDLDSEYFVQNMISDKMLSVYKSAKEYAMQSDERDFYAIVQVFGMWTKGGWDSWSLPPVATQKALLYLPLCYGADGMFHYRFISFLSPDGFGDYVALTSTQSGKDYLPAEPYLPMWKLLEAENPILKSYGTKIKELSWKGSDTIMTSETKNAGLKKAAGMKSVMVSKTGKGNYEGYVQLGVYHGKNNSMYYMVVNRRGNYFNSGDIKEEKMVPPTSYTCYFPEAEAQSLRIVLDSKAKKRFGKNAVLMDTITSKVFKSKKGKFIINIPAGQGYLLQLVSAKQAKKQQMD